MSEFLESRSKLPPWAQWVIPFGVWTPNQFKGVCPECKLSIVWSLGHNDSMYSPNNSACTKTFDVAKIFPSKEDAELQALEKSGITIMPTAKQAAATAQEYITDTEQARYRGLKRWYNWALKNQESPKAAPAIEKYNAFMIDHPDI